MSLHEIVEISLHRISGFRLIQKSGWFSLKGSDVQDVRVRQCSFCLRFVGLPISPGAKSGAAEQKHI